MHPEPDEDRAGRLNGATHRDDFPIHTNGQILKHKAGRRR
jgi:hypothetical protein